MPGPEGAGRSAQYQDEAGDDQGDPPQPPEGRRVEGRRVGQGFDAEFPDDRDPRARQHASQGAVPVDQPGLEGHQGQRREAGAEARPCKENEPEDDGLAAQGDQDPQQADDGDRPATQHQAATVILRLVHRLLDDVVGHRRGGDQQL